MLSTCFVLKLPSGMRLLSLAYCTFRGVQDFDDSVKVHGVGKDRHKELARRARFWRHPLKVEREQNRKEKSKAFLLPFSLDALNYLIISPSSIG